MKYFITLLFDCQYPTVKIVALHKNQLYKRHIFNIIYTAKFLQTNKSLYLLSARPYLILILSNFSSMGSAAIIKKKTVAKA